MNFWYFILIINSGAAIAAGDGHGSFSDLIAPITNIVIIISFMVYKLRIPFNNYFKNQSENISETLLRAETKEKEAKELLIVAKIKTENLEKEIQKINENALLEIKKFEQVELSELEQKVKKAQEDSRLKIKAFEENQILKLKDDIFSSVLTETKSKVKANPDIQMKAAGKLIKGLQT